MSQVHVTTEINAPIEKVWDTVMDPDRLGEWVTIHRSVARVSDRPLSSGSTMRQTLRMHGVSFHVDWTLVNVQAPNRAEWQGHGPAGSRARISYRLSGDGGGPTRFDYTNEFSAPGGRLGNVASRVIVGAASEREAHHTLARLKALLENKK
ncbi:MAG TPA: SRPBCC family protein [Solirubrobacteraceae bacterium]|nr:SRPBCC family protein [Solirubrobacteraceae bacterium]